MSKPALTAVIITRNEADKISCCLESIKWVEEIVVVDDLSKDKTAEICRSYGAKVVSHESCGNFDRQRNIGIDHAESEWILQLDADEVVPEQLRRQIQQTLSGNVEYSGFQFRRKNFFLGHFMRYGGFYGAYSLKLFKKSAGRFIGHSVHEKLKVDGDIGRIEADIEHYPFPTISENIAKNNFYSAYGALALREANPVFDPKKLRYNLTIRPLKLFWKMYVKKKGYKDGVHGLIFCILFTFGPMLKWIKYWELFQKEKKG